MAAGSFAQLRLSWNRARRLADGVRPSADATETVRVERVLATARLGLGLFLLATVLLAEAVDDRHTAPNQALLLVYALHSAILLLLLRAWPEVRRTLIHAIHALDVAWAALITSFTGGPNSAFFGLFVFAILSAGYRWGFRATVGTALMTTAVLSAQVLALTAGGVIGRELRHRPMDVDLVISRYAYVLIGSLLLGYMAETQKQLRFESAAVTRIMGRVQARTSFTETLTAVSEELLRLFGAQRLLLVIQAAGAERLFLWRAESSGRAPPVAGRYSEADRGERDAYVFPPPGEVWAATRARPGSALRILTIDGEPGPASGGPMLPPTFLTAEPFRRVLGAAISLGREWEDRLFLFEAGRAGARELRLLRAVVRQVGPVIYNVYLLRRLRGRTGALERAWLARELHDGIVQSLIGLEMHIDALRRRTGDAPATTATHLAEIQHLLRQEVAGVRELMQRMRPIHLDPSRLTEYLVDLVDKFQRETGIVAHFACELDEVALRPRVCTELARIVQEALANVRRHSGARNVVVRFESTNDHWRLTVADDGRGFGFSGHLSGAELEEARAGPAIIGERVRSIGGELAVESQPGQGARLQVTLPRVANA